MTALLAGLLVAALIGWSVPRLLRRLIRARLGGYQHSWVTPDQRPMRSERPRSVAVLGAGVAGLTAAVTLARRGFGVTVFEANSYLGGKLGSWPISLGGETAWVSHGFHAFFPHYHNLNRFLDSLQARRGFKNIGDYVIIGRDGQTVRFAQLDRTPVFNLWSMSRAGIYRLRDVLLGPARDLMGIFLEYDAEQTPRRYDQLSFAQFDALAKLPPRLKLAFNTFSRAFFADEDKLSLAELIKCFHFYYLSHDGGLLYDFPDRDYEAALLQPIRAELARHQATLRLSTPVHSLEAKEGVFQVNGEAFHKVVLATDVVGARHLVGNARGLPPKLSQQFQSLVPGQRYAVLRLWTDLDVRQDIPVFVITDRVRVLDAFTVYHRLEQESAEWVARHGGAVLELHCYAVPEELSEEEVQRALLEEMVHFFPELRGFATRHLHFQLRRDFTAFHVGMWEKRPTSASGVPGLYFAGDWVKLPFPAMLLEAACASGLWASNQVLEEEGLRPEPITSVPLRGLMAGMPQPPARRALTER